MGDSIPNSKKKITYRPNYLIYEDENYIDPCPHCLFRYCKCDFLVGEPSSFLYSDDYSDDYSSDWKKENNSKELDDPPYHPWLVNISESDESF